VVVREGGEGGEEGEEEEEEEEEEEGEGVGGEGGEVAGGAGEVDEAVGEGDGNAKIKIESVFLKKLEHLSRTDKISWPL